MPTISPEQRLAIAIGVPTLAFILFLWYRRRQNLENFDDENDEDAQAPEAQVATVFETTLEVKIPQSASGAVIGRAGVVIKKIQKDTGTFINFKDDDEPNENDFSEEKRPKERTVVIKGEREKARKAELMIKKIVSDQPKKITEEYFVPQRACGRIIGRSGTTIRHLCQVSGAKIVIDRSEIRPDVPRKCTITGTADQIANAKGLLDEKIEEHNSGMARKRMPAVQPLTPMSAPTLAQGPPLPPPSNADSSLPATVQYPVIDDYVEVFVSAVDNPGHFWVQLVKRHDAQELDRLVSELTDEANTGGEESILESVKVGDMCCAPFTQDESWYRAQVTKVNSDGTVSLFYVDYGDSGSVPKYRLRKLRDEQLQLPFQAIECYLANVKPKGGEWSVAAGDLFKEMVHYPDWLVIMTKAVKYCGHIPCLAVYNTTTDRDVFVNEEMVQVGYAVQDLNYPLPPEQPVQLPEAAAAIEVNARDVTDSGDSTTISGKSTQEDTTDSAESFDVSEPITPKRFSPVKTALVKRVSRDYSSTTGSPSQKEKETAHSGLDEEKTTFQPIETSIDTEGAKESQSLNAATLQSILDIEKEDNDETHQKTMSTPVKKPEEETTIQPEVKTPKRESAPALKPEVEAMIKQEVSRAFEAEIAPAEEAIVESSVAGLESVDEGRAELEKAASVNGENTSENTTNGDSTSEQSHVEMTLNVKSNGLVEQVREEDDDDLETFSPTYKEKVMANKTFVSSVTINREQPTGATLTLIPSQKPTGVIEMSENTSIHLATSEELNSKEREAAEIQLVASEVLHSKEEEVTEIQLAASEVLHSKEEEAAEIQLATSEVLHSKEREEADIQLVTSEVLHSKEREEAEIQLATSEVLHSKEGEVTEIAQNGEDSTMSSEEDTDNYQVKSSQFSGNAIEVVIDQKDGALQASRSGLQEEEPEVVTVSEAVENNAAEDSANADATREEEDAEKEPTVVHSGSEDNQSDSEEGDIDSDPESFASALDEPASDTDSLGYDTARAQFSSSTTSLEYATAVGDTDTETIGPQHGDRGTPVNSDTEEEEVGEGEKTPKRKMSVEDVDTEEELTPKGSFAAAARFESEQDLGYKGDTERSTENLHE